MTAWPTVTAVVFGSRRGPARCPCGEHGCGARLPGYSGTYMGTLVGTIGDHWATATIGRCLRQFRWTYSVAGDTVAGGDGTAFVCSNAPSVALTTTKGVSVTALAEAPNAGGCGAPSITLTATVAAFNGDEYAAYGCGDGDGDVLRRGCVDWGGDAEPRCRGDRRLLPRLRLQTGTAHLYTADVCGRGYELL